MYLCKKQMGERWLIKSLNMEMSILTVWFQKYFWLFLKGMCNILWMKKNIQISHHMIRVYFARDYIFFKGPNNVIGLYWREKFEWEQLLWFFLGSCRVLVYVFFFKLVWLGYFQTVIIHITNTSNSTNLAGK